jgi:hypothetical protein
MVGSHEERLLALYTDKIDGKHWSLLDVEVLLSAGDDWYGGGRTKNVVYAECVRIMNFRFDKLLPLSSGAFLEARTKHGVTFNDGVERALDGSWFQVPGDSHSRGLVEMRVLFDVFSLKVEVLHGRESERLISPFVAVIRDNRRMNTLRKMCKGLGTEYLVQGKVDAFVSTLGEKLHGSNRVAAKCWYLLAD